MSDISGSQPKSWSFLIIFLQNGSAWKQNCTSYQISDSPVCEPMLRLHYHDWRGAGFGKIVAELVNTWKYHEILYNLQIRPMEAYGAHHEWAMLALLLRVRLRFLKSKLLGKLALQAGKGGEFRFNDMCESEDGGWHGVMGAPIFQREIRWSGGLSAVLAGNGGGWLDMLGITSNQDWQ